MGSLAYGNEAEVASLVQDGVPQVLLTLLSNLWRMREDDRSEIGQTIESVSRSLRNISRFLGFPRDVLLEVIFRFEKSS